MEMGNLQYCRKAAVLHDSIMATAIVANDRLVTTCVKPNFNPPRSKEIRNMLIQFTLMAKIPSTSEGYFGKLGYVTVHHDKLDYFLFPMIHNEEFTLVVMVSPPYDHDELVGMIRDQMRSANKVHSSDETLASRMRTQQGKPLN